MKISKNEQVKIKAKILKIAVKLIGEYGYKKTSMSKIAKEAKIGEATIYNYFSTKEHILYAYHLDIQLKTKQMLIENDEFNEFSLKDQLQYLLETNLDLLKKDRSFMLEIYEEIFYKSFNHPSLEKGNDELKLIASELIDIAVEADEIEPMPFSNTILNLFVNYYFGILYYWINDDSEDFENTTILIDKSLSVVYVLLQSGLISKLEDMVSFLIKTHFLNKIKPTKIFKKKMSFGNKK
ncbi:MAG: AcrR family transcriptional regulator [Sulfurimonas sp.]|jgi:AcrR family transcriptional regulator